MKITITTHTPERGEETLIVENVRTIQIEDADAPHCDFITAHPSWYQDRLTGGEITEPVNIKGNLPQGIGSEIAFAPDFEEVELRLDDDAESERLFSFDPATGALAIGPGVTMDEAAREFIAALERQIAGKVTSVEIAQK